MKSENEIRQRIAVEEARLDGYMKGGLDAIWPVDRQSEVIRQRIGALEWVLKDTKESSS